MSSSHMEIYVSIVPVNLNGNEDDMVDETRELCEVVGDASIIIFVNRRGNRARAVWRTDTGPRLIQRSLVPGSFRYDAFRALSPWPVMAITAEVDPASMTFEKIVRVDEHPDIHAEVSRIMLHSRGLPDTLLRLQIVNAVLEGAQQGTTSKKN